MLCQIDVSSLSDQYRDTMLTVLTFNQHCRFVLVYHFFSFIGYILVLKLPEIKKKQLVLKLPEKIDNYR